MVVEELSAGQSEEAVDVFCDAFADYPVMRHVVGPDAPEYHERLRTLIRFFVGARVWRDEPMFTVSDGTQAVGVAMVTLPGVREAAPALAHYREVVWGELGVGARRRYEALGEIWREFAIPDPHHHLNMIGVRRSHHGRGLSRQLIEVVHQLSRDHPDSVGVTLTTEDETNVPLYEHFGYEIVGHVKIADGFETWGFFRPAEASA